LNLFDLPIVSTERFDLFNVADLVDHSDPVDRNLEPCTKFLLNFSDLLLILLLIFVAVKELFSILLEFLSDFFRRKNHPVATADCRDDRDHEPDFCRIAY
jgi:hypothetical protein